VLYLGYPIVPRGREDKVSNNLTVSRRIEGIALATELLIEVLSVDNIPIVGEGNGIRAFANDDRLHIAYPTGATGRIAIMPDGDIPGEPAQGLLTEHLGYQAHISTKVEPFAVSSSNARTLLTTMLESKQCEEGNPSYILVGGINPKNAASLVQLRLSFNSVQTTTL